MAIYAETEHVGFSPTRETFASSKREAVRCLALAFGGGVIDNLLLLGGR